MKVCHIQDVKSYCRVPGTEQSDHSKSGWVHTLQTCQRQLKKNKKQKQINTSKINDGNGRTRPGLSEVTPQIVSEGLKNTQTDSGVKLSEQQEAEVSFVCLFV